MEKFITACRRRVKISSIHVAVLPMWALRHFALSAENKLYLYDNRELKKVRGTPHPTPPFVSICPDIELLNQFEYFQTRFQG